MDLEDSRRAPVSGATPPALEHFETAMAQLQCYCGNPLATIDRALAEAPRFAMAHVLRAYLGVLATEAPALELARAGLRALAPLPLNPREAGHCAAIEALTQGRWQVGIAALDRVLADQPLDLLALQVEHIFNFLVGDARNLRDGVARVKAAWSREIPGYHAVLGMHAFGLEECGDYPRAEREGRNAIELNPLDAWAHHAVTHVLEMQGRVDEGIAWMTSRASDWSTDNFFAIHNWWHLALFLLDRGEQAPVLALYDRRIRGTQSRVVLDLVDASALLWRLFLRGVEVGPRSAELAEAWAPMTRDGLYAFNDVHAAMAVILAGQEDRVADLLATMERQAARNEAEENLTNITMTRDIGLPVVRALRSFARGDHRRAIELLGRVRPIAQRFGGSHAQRDLLDQTLLVAAQRTGDRALARALLREREELRPGHNRAFA